MYKLHSSALAVVRVSDGATIPASASNRDYVDYLAWVALGNTPGPADDSTAQQRAQAQIDAKERETLLPREVRESLLALIDNLPPGKQTQLAATKAKVRAVDAEIATLRAKL